MFLPLNPLLTSSTCPCPLSLPSILGPFTTIMLFLILYIPMWNLCFE